jgi:hypothetical protein
MGFYYREYTWKQPFQLRGEKPWGPKDSQQHHEKGGLVSIEIDPLDSYQQMSFSNSRCSQCQILVGSNENIDTSNHEPDSQYDTVLRVLQVRKRAHHL